MTRASLFNSPLFRSQGHEQLPLVVGRVPATERDKRKPLKLGFRSEKGQSMVEFLFIFILFTSIIFFVLQLTIIANVKSLLNLATYSAAREYITSHSSGMAQAAAATYMNPFLPGVGNGEVMYVSISTNPSSTPSFGRQVTVTGTAYYRLQMPIVRNFFGVNGYTGVIPLESKCTMTMETDGDN
jgi:Flp pilus assembly protein TadG